MANYPDATITQIYSTPHSLNAWVRFTDNTTATDKGFKKIQGVSTDGVTNTFTTGNQGLFVLSSVRVVTDATDTVITAIYVPTFP